MALPCTVAYPLTTLQFTNAGADITSVLAASITTPLVVPKAIRDAVAADGAANQILTAGPGAQLLWADAADFTPGLAAVLGESPDAGGLTVVNLASMALSADAGASSCVLSAAASSDLLNISTAADESGATYAFSGKYWPLVIAGTLYRVPLFVDPA